MIGIQDSLCAKWGVGGCGLLGLLQGVGFVEGFALEHWDEVGVAEDFFSPEVGGVAFFVDAIHFLAAFWADGDDHDSTCFEHLHQAMG